MDSDDTTVEATIQNVTAKEMNLMTLELTTGK